MRKELRFLLGPPGCGKSTYTRRKADVLNAKVVNLDDVRWMLGYRYKAIQEPAVNAVGHALVRGFMVDRQNIILDESYTTLSDLLPYILLAADYDYKKIGVVFKTPQNVCRERRDDGTFPLHRITEKAAELERDFMKIVELMTELEEAA